MRILTVSHGPDLWPLLGPFLCDRQVHKELGGPIYSTEASTWFVALQGKQVLGFCSMRQANGCSWFDYGYVLPESRGKGVFAKLAQARDLAVQSPVIRVAVRETRWQHYVERGWSVTSRRGSWVYGEKKA